MIPVRHPDEPDAGGPTVTGPSRPGAAKSRRSGYVVAGALNAVMLWVVNSLLGWGWPPFLTDQFDSLLPWIDVSLAATIAVNLLWIWRDPAWLRHLGQIGLDAITALVAVRTWQIFPFDFAHYWGGWETVARVMIAVGFFGSLVDASVRTVILARKV